MTGTDLRGQFSGGYVETGQTPDVYFFGALVTCQTRVAKGMSSAP